MTRAQIVTYLAAILTSIHDVGRGTPESTGYIAVGMNMEHWTDLKSIMLRAGLITCDANWMELTEKGHEMARKINASIAATASIRA